MSFARLTFAVLFFGFYAQADVLHPLSDSGIHGPSYQKILDQMDALEKKHRGYIRVVEYGKTVEGRPLRLVLLMAANQLLSRRPAMVVTGSTHGNEYLNIADRLPGELTRLAMVNNSAMNQFLRVGGVVVFVPVLNPDGYERRMRHNADGKDLNRDWPIKAAGHRGFKEVESTALGTYLDRLKVKMNLQYLLAVDYHCCLGGIIHPWSFQKADIPKKRRARHQKYGHLANQAGLNVKVGSAADLIWYLPKGTSTDYHYSKYGALALTYEGVVGREDQWLDRHVKWWQLMARELMTEMLPMGPRVSAANWLAPQFW